MFRRLISKVATTPRCMVSHRVSARMFSDEASTEAPPAAPPALSIDDALTIRYAILDKLKEMRVRGVMQTIVKAPGDIMYRYDAVRRILRDVTQFCIENLSAEGKVNIPAMGASHLLAYNFDTIYLVLSYQPEGRVLREAMEEQWGEVMNICFETDTAITYNSRVSNEAAQRIAYMYLEFTKSAEFDGMLENALEGLEVAPEGNQHHAQRAAQIEQRARETRVMAVCSPFLERLYAQYQYNGAEGFFLMQKALEAHVMNGDVIQALGEASDIAMRKAGLA